MKHSSQRESVSLWHPWSDKKGQRHTLSLLQSLSSENIEQLIYNIAEGEQYALCTDIFKEVSEEMLLHPSTEAYLSRSGGLTALRCKNKRKSGFVIPGITWGDSGENIHESTLSAIGNTFKLFGYEAITPASLSEKVLRSTLPERCYISRPSVMIRRTFLEDGSQQRIFNLKEFRGETGYENDMIKAYLSIAKKGVPSPFTAPIGFANINEPWADYECSWMQCTMIAHGEGLQPIAVNGVPPIEGQIFTKWLWRGSLDDCLEAGYTLMNVERGYCYGEKSDFLGIWSDILWEKYQRENDEQVKDIIKKMMVGLPGRFLKQPEILTLVHQSQLTEQDKESIRANNPIVMPILREWEAGQSPLSNWFMRVDTESEQAIQSAQLTPIGHFIINECQREVYHAAKSEEQRGNRVIRIYVDSFTTVDPPDIEETNKRGGWKRKVYHHVTIQNGRFSGISLEKGQSVLKATGYKHGSKERKELEKELPP